MDSQEHMKVHFSFLWSLVSMCACCVVYVYICVSYDLWISMGVCVCLWICLHQSVRWAAVHLRGVCLWARWRPGGLAGVAHPPRPWAHLQRQVQSGTWYCSTLCLGSTSSASYQRFPDGLDQGQMVRFLITSFIVRFKSPRAQIFGKKWLALFSLNHSAGYYLRQ